MIFMLPKVPASLPFFSLAPAESALEVVLTEDILVEAALSGHNDGAGHDG